MKLGETMVKRKAKFCANVGSKVEEVGLGVGPTEVLVGLERHVAGSWPTVANNHVGVPTNSATKVVADVAVGEAPGIERLWLLLEQAWYEAW